MSVWLWVLLVQVSLHDDFSTLYELLGSAPEISCVDTHFEPWRTARKRPRHIGVCLGSAPSIVSFQWYLRRSHASPGHLAAVATDPSSDYCVEFITSLV